MISTRTLLAKNLASVKHLKWYISCYIVFPQLQEGSKKELTKKIQIVTIVKFSLFSNYTFLQVLVLCAPMPVKFSLVSSKHILLIFLGKFYHCFNQPSWNSHTFSDFILLFFSILLLFF